VYDSFDAKSLAQQVRDALLALATAFAEIMVAASIGNANSTATSTKLSRLFPGGQ
jgi:hypothetical protein